MSTELRTQIIPASGELPISTTANFLFLLSASAAVTVRFQRGGTSFGATGVQAGYVKGVVNPWDRATITGTAGVTVSYFIGTEELREDITDFRQQIAIIAGIVQTTEAPAATIVSTASAALATGNSLDISANLSRKRITICNESTSAGSVWVRDQAATTNAGEELQPGTSKEFKGSYALRVRNNSGLSANISTNEES